MNVGTGRFIELNNYHGHVVTSFAPSSRCQASLEDSLTDSWKFGFLQRLPLDSATMSRTICFPFCHFKKSVEAKLTVFNCSLTKSTSCWLDMQSLVQEYPESMISEFGTIINIPYPFTCRCLIFGEIFHSTIALTQLSKQPCISMITIYYYTPIS